MNRLPARNQQHVTTTRYEFGAAYGSVHTVPLEPFVPAVEIFCVLLAMGFAASTAGFYLSKLF